MQSYRTYKVELPKPAPQVEKPEEVLDPFDPLPRPRSAPRLQESAMAAVRQAAEEAIIEVVEAGDIEESKQQSSPPVFCEIKITVEESSLYVRAMCVVAVVTMVLLSVLGLILTMYDSTSSEEAYFSQWVWLVCAVIYASIMLLIEIKPECPRSKDSFQAHVYRAAPVLATQVGRAGLFGFAGIQSLLIRPIFLAVPSCIVLFLSAVLLTLDTRFRCGRFEQGTEPKSVSLPPSLNSSAAGQQQMVRVIESRHVTQEHVMPRVTLGIQDCQAA